MIILEAVRSLKGKLKTIYDEREAGNITNLVIENVTGYTKSEQLVKQNDLFNEEQSEKLKHFENELLQYKPVQYVLKEAWFDGMKFYVDRNVLIPRPETEELVEWIVNENNYSSTPRINNLPLTFLDIGTGSGCIAISLKKKIPFSVVYALDISKKVLKITLKNATANQVKIEFIQADILNISKQQNFTQFDIIVSNPPYIQQSEAKEMGKNVLMYEPASALFVPGQNALLFYEAIADFALINLKRNHGKLYFEINELKGKEVTDMLAAKGFSNIILKKDLQNKDRMVSATLNE